jgi:beta-galactosidase/beta-glucuronidase
MMNRFLLCLGAATILAAQPVPRPEYPQPQFEREEWLNLNGTWEFEFSESTGAPERFSRSIIVPFCPESKLSGIADPSFHPGMWYRRSFTVPRDWKDKHVLLHFGAVNYWATVWVNGAIAGQHEGGQTPFQFDITSLFHTGSNTVAVHAEFPPTDRYIPRGKQYWEPKSRSIYYTRTSGIWQTVWLEPVAAAHLDSVRINPSNDGLVTIYAHVEGVQPGLELRSTASSNGTVVAATTAPVNSPRVSASFTVNQPKLWSPDFPNLYDLAFELVRNGQVLDRVKSYTGFRSVSTRNDRVLLNEHPYYLKMVLDQGYWPDSILTPPSDEAIQYDIRMTKEMGFNGARKHQKLEDPRYLYWADKLGLLVSSEMANAFGFDDQAAARFTREWMQAVGRDYNHPSIVIWVPINESWGVPDLEERRQRNYLKALYDLTRAFDSSRLVVDNDGWEHTDHTDLFNIHDYARTGDILASKYKDIGRPGASIPDNARPALAPGAKYNGSPVVLSEFGGVAFIPPGHNVPEESWGYSGVEKTDSDALTRLRGLYTSISKVPGFAGICYTQLTDIEQEINGLMTYDRKPKFDTRLIREMNELLP